MWSKNNPCVIHIGEMDKMLKAVRFEGWGFPSPRQYCKKNNEEYINDLVILKGDYEYRLRIIEKLLRELTSEGITAIIERKII